MALILCPDCGRSVSSSASTCPQCGRPIAPPAIPPPLPPALPIYPSNATAALRKQQRSSIGSFFKFMFIALLVVGAGWGILNISEFWDAAEKDRATHPIAEPQHDAYQRDRGEDAYYTAVGFIRKQLKAPATAKFSNLRDQETGYSLERTNTWLAWGFVDSQNSFGALLRNKWWACVEGLPGDKFRFIYFRVGETEVGDLPASWQR